ncbi:hypothetical protein BJ165DRAFT_1503430 [Panaeolus papilionaceus]|nr:hypothetical protein BJ165DRAFT_1503430 [Panaeolus papilionaceus]
MRSLPFGASLLWRTILTSASPLMISQSSLLRDGSWQEPQSAMFGMWNEATSPPILPWNRIGIRKSLSAVSWSYILDVDRTISLTQSKDDVHKAWRSPHHYIGEEATMVSFPGQLSSKSY